MTVQPAPFRNQDSLPLYKVSLSSYSCRSIRFSHLFCRTISFFLFTDLNTASLKHCYLISSKFAIYRLAVLLSDSIVHCVNEGSYSVLSPVSTGMGIHFGMGIPSQYVASQLGQLSFASLWGKGGNVTSAGWQVTLCDPTWHVSSHIGESRL